MKSYAQKCAAYALVLKSNPGLSANELGRRYQGTDLGMRKQDRNDFVKGYKQQLADKTEFIKNISNSDMTDGTKKKMEKMADRTAYKFAKNNTRRGQKANTENIIYKNVKDLERRTFNRIPNFGDGAYIEFYG